MADLVESDDGFGQEYLAPLPRLRTASTSSRRSDSSRTGSSSRIKTPTLRHRTSTLSGRSNESDSSEIYAPRPIRALHAETRRWLGTSEMGSPASSRAVSPDSEVVVFPTGSKFRSASSASTSSSRRVHRSMSFSSLKENGQGQVPASPTKRRSSRLTGIGEDVGGDPTRSTTSRSEGSTEVGMARRWVKWMHAQGLRDWVVLTSVSASILVKWTIGLGSYSGEGTPPMHGDYEAQRHWMELTIHLPFREWYTYDLPYWGLDYPPLTAYVSWLCGWVGSFINPTWFTLDASRGIETPGSKVYMRATVLAFDTLVFVPAILWFVKTWHHGRSQRTQSTALLSLLFHPALLLIDFGHFQYNSVMLGFTILSLAAFARNRDSLGAIFFVLSLGFKQMALYYAPAIGSYLLAKCLHLGPTNGKGQAHLIRLGIVTATSFLLLFAPFLPPFSPVTSILDPISRIFPFGRGLFEDKVANFWCASNVVLKWRNWTSSALLIRMSAALTALGFLPAVVGMLVTGWNLQVEEKPIVGASSGIINSSNSNNKGVNDGAETPTQTKLSMATAAAAALSAASSSTSNQSEPAPALQLLPYALLTSAMSFFLFSFQVHEKTILLPLMPLALLLSGAAPSSAVYEWGMLVSNAAVFSMWPLLKKDGLGLQYAATLMLWNRLMGYDVLSFLRWPKSFVGLLALIFYPTALALHVLEVVIVPPARLPDLFPVLNVLLCTPIFGLVWLWSIKRGWEVQWALGGLGGGLLGGSRKTGLKSKGESKGETLKMAKLGSSNENGNVSRGAQLRL